MPSQRQEQGPAADGPARSPGQGGASGAPGLVPGNPAASELFVRMSLPPDDIDIMPPEGELLSPEDIATVRAWIESGAAF